MLKPSLCCREARQVLPTGAKMPKYVKVLIDDACGFLKEHAREVKTHNALLWTAMNIGRFKPSPLRGLEVLLRIPVSLVLMVLRGLLVAALMRNNRARRMSLMMKMEMKALRITLKTKKTILRYRR